MRPPSEALDRVRHQIADEEADGAVAPPLAHMHVLVSQQVGRDPSPPDDHQTPDSDAIGAGRHRAALPQQVVAALLDRHATTLGMPADFRPGGLTEPVPGTVTARLASCVDGGMDAQHMPGLPWYADESPTSTIVIHVPHAGTYIPDDVRSAILLADDDLRCELRLMTDHCTDLIARLVASRCDVSVFENRLSRLVVDPERFPDEREEMLTVGMGAVYTQTSSRRPLRHADAERDALLLAEYFDPYASAVEALVERTVRRHGTCTIIDLHSYPSASLPYELRPTARRPGACIGTDRFHTPDLLRTATLAAFEGVKGGTLLDSPFSGTYVPARHFRQDPRVQSVMVELRRDLYLDDRGAVNDGCLSELATRVAALADSLAVGGQ
ncbi:MAG: hypothetical protein RJB61_768 [Actinomycetota bacterium]